MEITSPGMCKSGPWLKGCCSSVYRLQALPMTESHLCALWLSVEHCRKIILLTSSTSQFIPHHHLWPYNCCAGYALASFCCYLQKWCFWWVLPSHADSLQQHHFPHCRSLTLCCTNLSCSLCVLLCLTCLHTCVYGCVHNKGTYVHEASLFVLFVPQLCLFFFFSYQASLFGQDLYAWGRSRQQLRRPVFSSQKQHKCMHPGCTKSYWARENLVRHQVTKHGRHRTRRKPPPNTWIMIGHNTDSELPHCAFQVGSGKPADESKGILGLDQSVIDMIKSESCDPGELIDVILQSKGQDETLTSRDSGAPDKRNQERVLPTHQEEVYAGSHSKEEEASDQDLKALPLKLYKSSKEQRKETESGNIFPEAYDHGWEDHCPTLIPCTPKKKKPVRRCRVCYAEGKRKEVRYHCPKCPGSPGLHVEECFRIYHQNKWWQ